ncbi:MAG: alpha/beta fold hydrolase [Planctomycetota bacterium]
MSLSNAVEFRCESRSGSTSPSQMVVTVHGMLASRRSMGAISRAMQRQGFTTLDWHYPSLRGSIEAHAERLAEQIESLASVSGLSRLHFVTHSMGGIIARAAIHMTRLEARFPMLCGSLVMLAPPNAGSRLAHLPLGPFSSLFPQMRELSEDGDSFVNRLPQPRQMAVGVIAAARDFVVRSEATHLTCQRDHATIETTHQALVRDQRAIKLVTRFLQNRRFDATLPCRLVG